MSKVSKESATQGGDYGPVVDRSEDVDGYRIGFTTFKADIDATPLMRGLPGDRCPCPHWGYVIAGSMTFRFSEGDEVYEAGDAFYARPGHVPVQNQPGTEILMFSPADELRATEAVMMKNMQAMQSS